MNFFYRAIIKSLYLIFVFNTVIMPFNCNGMSQKQSSYTITGVEARFNTAREESWNTSAEEEVSRDSSLPPSLGSNTSLSLPFSSSRSSSSFPALDNVAPPLPEEFYIIPRIPNLIQYDILLPPETLLSNQLNQLESDDSDDTPLGTSSSLGEASSGPEIRSSSVSSQAHAQQVSDRVQPPAQLNAHLPGLTTRAAVLRAVALGTAVVIMDPVLIGITNLSNTIIGTTQPLLPDGSDSNDGSGGGDGPPPDGNPSSGNGPPNLPPGPSSDNGPSALPPGGDGPPPDSNPPSGNGPLPGPPPDNDPPVPPPGGGGPLPHPGGGDDPPVLPPGPPLGDSSWWTILRSIKNKRTVLEVPNGKELGTIALSQFQELVVPPLSEVQEEQTLVSTVTTQGSTESMTAANLGNFQQDIIKYTAATPIIAFDYLNIMSSALNARFSSIKHHSASPLPSGDEDNIKKGFWVGTTWSGTKQKQNTNILTFKNQQQGVIFGFDTEFNDNMIIGTAYILGLSKTKFDGTVNNKQRTNLHIAALYTKYNFLSNVTLNSYMKYGRALVKNNDTTNDINLIGKTRSDIMRAKLEAYYQYNVEILLLKLIAGIKFDYYITKSYTARSQDFYVNVPTRQGKRVSFEAGIVLSKNIALKKFIINPEVHFRLERAILTSGSSRIISVNDVAAQTQIWSTRPSNSSGLRDIICIVGGSVRTQPSSMIDIGIGYDYSFKKNFSNYSIYFSNKIKF